MRPRALVLTTVHHPDDNRIRNKTIGVLARRFEVRYATRAPGPTSAVGLRWVPLPGGRWRRNLAAFRVALLGRYDVLSLHDPETIPLGLAVRAIRRRPVVFDLHEDLPVQVLTKPWVPRWLRRPLGWLTGRALRIAERWMVVTLAEESYAARFRRLHPVLPNHLLVEELPPPRAEANGRAVYVGDVTVERGLVEAAAACRAAGVPLDVIGACPPAVEERLQAEGAEVELLGRLPHPEAMRRAAAASAALSPLRDLPNYRESIPTKVLEYLALGVPVVATDLPGTRRLVSGLEGVRLVPVGDIGEMAAALRWAVGPEAKRLALAGAEEVRARFRWPADRLLDLYLALVGG